MPITMINETQTAELQDALDHAQEICAQEKKDASIVAMGSNSWVAIPTEVGEYYSGTLIRVCFTDVARRPDDNEYEPNTYYQNSETGAYINIKTKPE